MDLTVNPDKATILAVHKSKNHNLHKIPRSSINLLKGLGVEGDCHMGRTVKHRSRVAQDPNQPNLRQVHLMHAELFVELASKGYDIKPGKLGENITTQGIDLLGLPKGTLLHLGDSAIVCITGLRNPCQQLNNYMPGLMQAVLERDTDGLLIRKSGIMGIVVQGGAIYPGDTITVQLPAQPYIKLERV